MKQDETDIRRTARVAGALYVIVFIAIFAQLTRESVVAAGDAAAVADALRAMAGRYRLAMAADLVAAAAYLGVTVLLYSVLAPAGRTLAQLSVAFGVTGSAIMAGNMVQHLAPLIVLESAPALGGFSAAELHALARLSLRLHGQGYGIAGVFFGIHLILLGVLVLRAGYLPRWLGALVAAGGLAYLADSVAGFAAPALARRLDPVSMLPGLAELALALWLLVFAVDAGKWRERAERRA